MRENMTRVDKLFYVVVVVVVVVVAVVVAGGGDAHRGPVCAVVRQSPDGHNRTLQLYRPRPGRDRRR